MATTSGFTNLAFILCIPMHKLPYSSQCDDRDRFQRQRHAAVSHHVMIIPSSVSSTSAPARVSSVHHRSDAIGFLDLEFLCITNTGFPPRQRPRQLPGPAVHRSKRGIRSPPIVVPCSLDARMVKSQTGSISSRTLVMVMSAPMSRSTSKMPVRVGLMPTF